MKKKTCKIHYRKLLREVGTFPDRPLSKLITEALNTEKQSKIIRNTVSMRICDTPDDDGKRLLNNIYLDDKFVFGDICLFSPGKMQSLIEMSENEHRSLDDVLNAWTIAESTAPDGHEYLQGIAYWMAIGDHFYQIQHSSLQVKAMEQYLTWLIRDNAGVLGSDQKVTLQVLFDRSQVGGDLGEIKSVEIGGVVPETVPLDSEVGSSSAYKTVEENIRSKVGDVSATFGKAKKILSELLGDIETDKLLKSMPPEAALEVSVNIGYRARKRKIQKEFMSDLSSGLRNLPDGELPVRGKDGELKGDDARLSADMGIKRLSETSNLLVYEDVSNQILEVHRRFLHDGKITA